MHLLDTSALSALMRSEPAHGRRLLELAPAEVGIAQPVLAEVRYGLARMPRSRRRTALEQRLAVLLHAIRRVAWNDEVSSEFGELRASLERRGERLDDFDAIIAAHALAYDSTLVTSNRRHFERVPRLSLEDWSR
ncbi:MAG: type II toxin-antitoxin system VapC family toxin [Myxococcales bacterium]|nr:type II toxin-antitoxin system VapC family toxin [Myxococcales bacterium]